MGGVIKETHLLIIPLADSLFSGAAGDGIVELIPGTFECFESSDAITITTDSLMTSKLSKIKIYKALFAACFMEKLDQTYITKLTCNKINVDTIEVGGEITLTNKDGSTKTIKLKPFVLDVSYDGVRDRDVVINGDFKIHFISFIGNVLSVLNSNHHFENPIQGSFTFHPTDKKPLPKVKPKPNNIFKPKTNTKQ